MKGLSILLCLVCPAAYSQLTLDAAREASVRKYHIGSYSYHEQFIGHNGYGAPLILTSDGGAAAFGDGDEGCMLVKLDKDGKETWKKTLGAKGDEMESQSVVQDKAGNFYVFILVYDHSKYNGGCERVVCLNKSGAVLWDKYIGTFTLLNKPTVNYLLTIADGRIAMRGQVVTEKPIEGKDPQYHYWEGYINSKGLITQKTGPVIDWSNQDWKKLFQPE